MKRNKNVNGVGKNDRVKKKTYLNPGFIIGGRRCGPGRIWENLVLL